MLRLPPSPSGPVTKAGPIRSGDLHLTIPGIQLSSQLVVAPGHRLWELGVHELNRIPLDLGQ